MTRARDLANLIGSGNFTTETLTATAGQTAFTPSNTFTSNFLQVFYNGLLLDPTVDYTENGTTITLTVPATAGDEMEVVTYNTFSVGDAITQTEADVRYVNADGDTMTGDLVVTSSNGKMVISQSNPAVGTENGRWEGRANSANYTSGFRSFVPSGQPGIDRVAAAIYTTTYTSSLQTGIDRLVVDPEGRVTMPYQPHILGSPRNTTGAGTANAFYTRQSNGLSWGGDRITVPVAGVYAISFNTICDTSTGRIDAEILVNGTAVAKSLSEDNGQGYHYRGLSITINLQANDYIQFNNNDWYNFGGTSNEEWRTVSVALIG